MTTTYAAHIITADATALGDPEIVVMTQADESGAADEVATYPLPADTDPAQVLADNGWRVTSGAEPVDTGYDIVTVEAADPIAIVKHVTYTRAQAEADAARVDTGWRIIIGDTMRDGGSATALARAAAISRERVYQIRDRRR